MDDLIAELPEGAVLTDRDVIERYRRDWARDPDAGWPIAVVRATCTEDVQAVLRWANAHNTRSCHAVRDPGCRAGRPRSRAASSCRWRRSRHPHRRGVTRCDRPAGLLNVEVKKAAGEHGLWYPPDPSSFEMCSIGGNARPTRAGCAASSTASPPTTCSACGCACRRHRAQARRPAAEGRRRPFAHEAVRRVRRTARRHHRTHPAPRPGTATGVDAGRGVPVDRGVGRRRPRDHVLAPALHARVDGSHLDQCRRGLHVDGARPHRRGDAHRALRRTGRSRCRRDRTDGTALPAHGASDVFTTSDVEEGEAFAAARRAAFPALERLGSLLLEDVGVALPALPTLVQGIEKIAADNAVTIAVVAHAGDGNAHPLVVYNEQDEDESRRAYLAFGQVMDLALEPGGTSPASTAWTVEEGLVADLSRRRRHGADAPHQGRARPERHFEPGRCAECRGARREPFPPWSYRGGAVPATDTGRPGSRASWSRPGARPVGPRSPISIIRTSPTGWPPCARRSPTCPPTATTSSPIRSVPCSGCTMWPSRVTAPAGARPARGTADPHGRPDIAAFFPPPMDIDAVRRGADGTVSSAARAIPTCPTGSPRPTDVADDRDAVSRAAGTSTSSQAWRLAGRARLVRSRQPGLLLTGLQLRPGGPNTTPSRSRRPCARRRSATSARTRGTAAGTGWPCRSSSSARSRRWVSSAYVPNMRSQMIRIPA